MPDQIGKGGPFIGCELPQLFLFRSRSPEREKPAAGGRGLIRCRHGWSRRLPHKLPSLARVHPTRVVAPAVLL